MGFGAVSEPRVWVAVGHAADFEARIAEIREKEAQEKQRQKEKKKRKRNKDKGGKDLSGEEDDEERDAGPMAGNDDDDMARIMGFGGFVAKK